MTFPLEEAVAILARLPAPARDETAQHLRVCRALDAFAARGLAVPPERIVPRIAATFDDASLLEPMTALLVESDGLATSVVMRARELIAGAPGLPDEAARAYAVRRVFIDPAATIGRYLTHEVVMQNDFRREELVRAWASAIGVPMEAGGKIETTERSERALSRLDYRRIRADEERLAIERRVLAEHSEAVREKQRKEAEALASAQRE